jgi:hypothetical protein
MDSFSKAVTPRTETVRREVAVMAASTKAARRLGRNDMANISEVLLNLVNTNKRKVLRLAAARNAWPKKGHGPFETLQIRLDTPIRPSGERNCLSRS